MPTPGDLDNEHRLRIKITLAHCVCSLASRSSDLLYWPLGTYCHRNRERESVRHRERKRERDRSSLQSLCPPPSLSLSSSSILSDMRDSVISHIEERITFVCCSKGTVSRDINSFFLNYGRDSCFCFSIIKYIVKC